MAVTEADKGRCRGHMGYAGTTSASSFNQGVPATIQTQFIVEGAMNNLLPESEPLFVQYLDNLDALEQQLVDDVGDLAAVKVGSIQVNLDELKHVIEFYRYWQGKLSNLLVVPPNPFDARPWLGSASGAGGVNVRVMGG